MKKTLFLALACVLAFASCNNEEGEGGKATISGYVYKVVHNSDDFSLSADTIPAVKEKVYIYYGNSKAVSDDTETGPDGYFTFKYLTKGNYRIFAYTTYDSGEKEAEIKSVKISRAEDANVGTIYIHEGKAYGTSMIEGKVLVNYYLKNSGLYVVDDSGSAKNFAAGDVRVYISRKGESEILDDTRTSADGTFVFQRLPKGEYTIYVYSSDMDFWDAYAENVTTAISCDVTVDELDKVITLDEDLIITDIK